MTTQLQVAPEQESDLGRKPFSVKHELVGNSLLTLDSIAELADFLPAESVEHNLGNVPEVLPGGDAPKLDLTPGEIVRTIDTNGCWIVLKHIEQHPDYRRLLADTVGDVSNRIGARDGGLRRREGFIFISAPNSTTPAHFDPEYNFLLQVRGTKDMVVGNFTDDKTAESELERYYGGGHRNIDTMPLDAQTFPLAPGDGVFVPPHAPHVVRNGPEPSISLSVTWYTATSERVGLVHGVNAKLRSLRLSPAPPGRHPAVDRVKATAWLAGRSAARGAKKLTHGRNPVASG